MDTILVLLIQLKRNVTLLKQMIKNDLHEFSKYWHENDINFCEIELGLASNHSMFDLTYDFDDLIDNCVLSSTCKEYQEEIQNCFKSCYNQCKIVLKSVRREQKTIRATEITEKHGKFMVITTNLTNNIECMCFFCKISQERLHDQIEYISRHLQRANEWVPSTGGHTEINKRFNEAREAFDDLMNQKYLEYNKLNQHVNEMVYELDDCLEIIQKYV